MHIQWTKGARKNLTQVEEYIDQNNPQAALDIVFKIIQSVEYLADHPAMGRTGRIFDTRELIIPNTPYIVLYRIKGKYLQVLRVLHSTMQWPEC